MKNTRVTLVPMKADDREQFILDNQEAFRYGALEEFGLRDDHVGEDGEIISRKTIERCMDESDHETYRIMHDGRKVGGVILSIDKKTHHNHLELFFVSPNEHSKGIGFAAWQAIEALHPETEVWETCTPYFEKRNLHFYINKCGFHTVEFFCQYHVSPESLQENDCTNNEGPDEFFRFIKVMK